jgi:catechol 2,3-dioxygenase-like lactoylglutathione lyase family enzyme
MSMKPEVVVLPVSDVDRAKGFYEGLGWRLAADFTAGEADPDWPSWYAEYMVREQAGEELPV